jgi:hypothetical protein
MPHEMRRFSGKSCSENQNTFHVKLLSHAVGAMYVKITEYSAAAAADGVT